MTSGDDALDLDGTWEMLTGEKGGCPLPTTSVWRARMVVEAGAFRLRAGGDALQGVFHPAPARGPGLVDAVVAEGWLRGMIVRGLYAMDGCRLTACFAAPGAARPKDIAAGDLLVVWEAITDVVRPGRPICDGKR